MKKIFLIIFLGALLFPLTSLATGVYSACPYGYPEYDKESDKCCTKIENEVCINPEDPVDVYYDGLIPCGKEVYKHPVFDESGNFVSGFPIQPRCTFCHFFVMLDGAIDFVLFKLVPPIAILMLVIGGVMFILGYFAGGGEESPKLFGQAKKLITSVFIGLIIMFAAWLIINLFFQFIGVQEWTGLQQGWFSINCPIQLPE